MDCECEGFRADDWLQWGGGVVDPEGFDSILDEVNASCDLPPVLNTIPETYKQMMNHKLRTRIGVTRGLFTGAVQYQYMTPTLDMRSKSQLEQREDEAKRKQHPWRYMEGA